MSNWLLKVAHIGFGVRQLGFKHAWNPWKKLNDSNNKKKQMVTR